MNDYIVLDGKQYKVAQTLYEPVTSRRRMVTTGLTGVTIVQDFTDASRIPQSFSFKLRVFTADRTDEQGYLKYLRDTTYPKPSIPMTLFDGTNINVIIVNDFKEVPRVGANIDGADDGITYVDVNLLRVHA